MNSIPKIVTLSAVSTQERRDLNLLKMKLHLSPLKRWAKILTALLVLICIAPFIPPLLIVFCLYRSLVHIYVRLFRRDLLGCILGPAIPMGLEHLTVKNSKFNIIVVAVLEANLSLDEVIALVEKRAAEMVKPNGEPIYAELHQYWVNVMGYLYWKKDENFSLKNHIRNYEEDSIREAKPLFEKDLAPILSELMPVRWEAGRSPWEAFRISNYYPEGQNEKPHLAFIIRIHHTLADGYSMKQLFEEFGSVKFKTPQITTLEHKLWEKVLRLLILAIRLPLDVAKQVINSIDGDNSLHVMDQKLTREYNTCIMQERYSTKTVKEISNRLSVNYSSVLYTAMSGGIRKVLEDAHLEVPKQISCLVPLPLPFRPQGLINHMWVFSLTLPLGIVSPKERLRIINNQFKNAKFNGTILMYLVSYKLMFLIPSCIVSFFFNRIQSTMGSSCFPGPELAVDNYLGCRLVDVFFHLGNPSGKMGLVGCTMSAMGRQHFIFMVDKVISPPVQIFNSIGKHTAQELDALYCISDVEGETNLGFAV